MSGTCAGGAVNTRMCMAAILSACVVLCVEGVSAQTNPSCKYFTVVSWDNLNNVTLGLSAEDVKWFQKTFSKKFPDICYAEPALTVPIVFFITVAPDVYHAAPAVNQICTQTNPGGGNITGQDRNTSSIIGTVDTTTSSTAVAP